MKKHKQTRAYSLGGIILVVLLVVVIVLIVCGCISFNFENCKDTRIASLLRATESGQTGGIVRELERDSSFNEADYPAADDSYTLEIIQAAESDGGKLCLYVYNPSAETKPLTARRISLSTEDTRKPQWQLYELTKLGRDGVFSKYVVEGLGIKTDNVRYYDISELFRDFDEDLDEPPASGTVDYIAVRVAKRYTAMTVDGNVFYACETTDVIEVTAVYAGFVRYGADNPFGSDQCDAHYVAFSTDKPMDKLMQCDVSFVSQSYSFSSEYSFNFWLVITGRGDEQTTVNEVYGDKEKHFETVSAGDTGSFKGSGWFSPTYEWDRIQTVDEFKKSVDLTASALEDIADKQWVLRFTETAYSTFSTSASSSYFYTSAQGRSVSEVTLLRLMFETEGTPYNIGTVSDTVTGDGKPDSPPTTWWDEFTLFCAQTFEVIADFFVRLWDAVMRSWKIILWVSLGILALVLVILPIVLIAKS